MEGKHDYGKTRAFKATCPDCGRVARGLSTDGRVKTIVRSCSNPPCKARGLILNRDKPKDGPLYRVRRSAAALTTYPFEVFNFLSREVVVLADTQSRADRVADALTGVPPKRNGRTR
jgi:hypothetical protein